MGQMITRPDGTSMTSMTETASSGMVALAQASVQARYTMALHRPRHGLQARQAVLALCADVDFADVAVYRKPVGGKCQARDCKGKGNGGCARCYGTGQNLIEGLSIRFAEDAVSAWRNLDVRSTTLLVDHEKTICRVEAIDLEANNSECVDFTVLKTTERRGFKGRDGTEEPPKGRDIVGQRLNSYGDMVYICVSTEDEHAQEVQRQRSKAKRNAVLALLPGSLKRSALEACQRTLRTGSPTGDRERLDAVLAAFDRLGVSAEMLERYVGHSLEKPREGDLALLRGLYAGISEGEVDVDALINAIDAGGDDADEAVASARAKAAELRAKKAAKKAADPKPAPTDVAEVKPEPTPTKAPAPAAGDDLGYGDPGPGDYDDLPG